MELEISPEPTQLEREAIKAALERVMGRVGPRQNLWWLAGLRENLGADDEDGRDVG